MKTHILKLSCFLLFLFTFFGCNDCNECEIKLEQTKKELQELKSENTSNAPKTSKIAFQSVGKYDVFGDFSVKDDRLTLFIPVTEKNLDIKDVKNISTNNINAILIRIDNNVNRSTPEKPIVKIIKKTYSISYLKLDTTKLKSHKKIKVIILHDNATDLTTHANKYKTCLKTQTDYIKDNCLGIYKSAPRPNEDGGDIIVGG
ncbi:hypothetical protein A9Q86_16475 [Flavobacteriales bacterium 33_180_T64]|nr:hypothetical protein A9Q86_16475 [Flavobacteriales bacterium 33_180_T64]